MNHIDNIKRKTIPAEVVKRNDTPAAWGVEAINESSDGEIYMAVFYGPGAYDLAVEYATAKYTNVRIIP